MQKGNYNGTTVVCPMCGEELRIEFDSAFCTCGWSINDIDLPEVLGIEDNNFI